ncbi:MAG: Lrp/AsnC family transcriptional regulator [Gammaproteobacteria bacterium]|nr:Lrp/AsnC family transcriptional regulator [Gammaproteobacteria bacterium]
MIKDSAFETALIEIISKGLPLVKQPYAAIAEQFGCSEPEVIEGIQRIMMRGDLKRFGVVVRHRQLGYRANGMVVWDVADDRVKEVGHCIGQYSFVTLCYQRPRRLPDWHYNLFSMIHGQDRDAVSEQVKFIVEQCGLHGVDHRILFSKRCFKQRGASYSRLQSERLGARRGSGING